MSDHYYTNEPASKESKIKIELEFRGKGYSFYTGSGVFSKDNLDPGSRLLLESLALAEGEVADIGCGWGPIGIILARENPLAQITMLDINRRAVGLCGENIALNGAENAQVLESDGMKALPENRLFDLIVTNPPIRAGKQVIYGIFRQAYDRLNSGGALYIVIRKKQGAPSAKAFLSQLFGNCETVNRGGGYWVLRSEKGERAEKMEKG
ncbi:MAG: class I SAM-dependent methyltransferase [Christensenellales bacterium]